MKNNQNGFSLIELLIVVVVFGIVAYALTGLMFSRSRVAERLSDSKAASDAAENALHAIAGIPYSNLAVGGSFSVVDTGTIQLVPCTAQTCDFVLDPENSSLFDSPAQGVTWQAGYAPPAGARVRYVRRWLVEEFNAELRLRRITVAVLSDEQSSKPLVMQNTIVGDH